MDQLEKLKTRIVALNTGNGTSDFDLNPSAVLPTNRGLSEAAVMIPVHISDAGQQVILTKRSAQLRNHPGQIAFPGGKRDAGDTSLAVTALREAQEEIGLNPIAVKVLATLPLHETVTGFSVTPVVCLINSPFVPKMDPNEVAEVFTVPLGHLLNPENYFVQARRWRDVDRHYFTVPYGPYYIWGATARILRSLAGEFP